MMEKLTQKRLKELLHYDSETGMFTRKVRTSNFINVGDIAGSPDRDNYVCISVDGKKYKAHRLAWLYEKGYFPEYEIDHINRITSDNRILNLREVSRSCNLRNTGNFSHNTSGVKGVWRDKIRNKWTAEIKVNQKKKYLGRYNNFDNAVCARLAMEQCLNWSNCDSNSPAYKYVKNNIQRRPT